MGKQWKQWLTLFFGVGATKTTADGDCSYEIERRLLLESKVMNNLDSILRSRDINLSTSVLLVKAMVFPVVTYGCESWAIKKGEHQGRERGDNRKECSSKEKENMYSHSIVCGSGVIGEIHLQRKDGG